MASVGRPRQFDEQQVLEAAMLQFWEHGYERTSLAQLRAATGLSSASIYHAFDSKEGLFQRAIEHYVSRPGSITSLTRDDSIPARDAVANLLHGTIDMQTDPSHPQGCLVSMTTDPGGGDESARPAQILAGQRAVDRQRIRLSVARGVDERALAADTDVDALTLTIHTFLLGLSVQVRDGVDAQHLHAAAELVMAAWDASAR